MPWMIVEENGQYCVHKQNADKSAGKKITCHGSKKEASDHMKALYANVEAIGVTGHFNLEGSSLNDKVKSVSGAFHEVVDPNPTQYWYVKDVYDDYLLVCNDQEEMYKVGYTVDGENDITIAPYDEWKKQKMVDAQMGGFQVTELSGIYGSFDGLAASHDVAFVSMSGEELFIEPSDLETYMLNGQAVIESTQTSTGDVVGLPIDLNGHDHKGGAGWIKGFELDASRNIIKFLVEWTKEGADLIRGNVRRFFSPSVDPLNKVILGGSLTNWPASRNSMSQMLLRPIELSMSMKGITMPTIEETLAAINSRLDEMDKKIGTKPTEMSTATGQQQAAPPTEPEEEEIGAELSQLVDDENAIEQLGQIANNKAKELVKLAQRKAHVVEFVSRVVGGTPDHPIGLPVRAAELTKVLLSLPEPQAKWVEKLLAKVWDSAAMVEFAERGVATMDRYSLRKPVPAEYSSLLRDWVAGGRSAQSFFEVNPEAGKAEDYNLSMFVSTNGGS